MGLLGLLLLSLWPSPTLPSCNYTPAHTVPSLQTPSSTTSPNATSFPNNRRRSKKQKPNPTAPTREEQGDHEVLSVGTLNVRFGIEDRLMDLEMLINGVPGGQPALQVLAIQEARYLQAKTRQPIWAIPVFDEATPDLGFLYNPNLVATRVALTSKYALVLKFELEPMSAILVNIHPKKIAPESYQEVVKELAALIERFSPTRHIFFLLGDFNVDVAHGKGAHCDTLRRALDSHHFRAVSPTASCTHTWRKTKDPDSPRSLIDFIWLKAPVFLTPTHMSAEWVNWIGELTPHPPSDHKLVTTTLPLKWKGRPIWTTRWNLAATQDTTPADYASALGECTRETEGQRLAFLRKHEKGSIDAETTASSLWN